MPRYPVEGNIDQLTELYKGLALIIYLVPSSAQHNGVSLKELAKEQILRLVWYASFPGNSTWHIVNPLTWHCVYGIEPQIYWQGGFLACAPSGALSNLLASGLAKGLKQINANWSFSDLGKVNSLIAAAMPVDWMFQAQKGFYWACQGDGIHFATTIAAISNNWEIKPLPIGPGLPVTRKFVNLSSDNCDLRLPHLPLIYRLLHGGNMFTPTGDSYAARLNSAPGCGIYNYQGNYANWEWSSPDRILEAKKRGNSNNADYPGLDYMTIFNLYVLNRPNYPSFYNNPYYQENLSQVYPFTSGGTTYASHSNPLTQHFLEYLSTAAHVLPAGDATHRCAKVIDMLPGFSADYGSAYLAYVKDYHCCNGGGGTNDPFAFKGGDGNDPFLMDSLTGVPFIPYEIPVDSIVQYDPTPAEIAADSLYYANMLIRDGISQQTDNSSINIYPNPNSGSFTIEFAEQNIYAIKVRNLYGSIIFQSQTDKVSKSKIELGNAPPGNYTVEIRGQNSYTVKKITVIK